MNEEDLQHFLYLVLRDAASAGSVETCVRQVEESRGNTRAYSNKFIAGYAKELTERLQDMGI